MQSITVVILLLGVRGYIELNKCVSILVKSLQRFKMASDTDDIIDQLLGETDCSGVEVAEAIPIKQQYKHERLIALAAGGQSEIYLNKTYSIDHI